MSDNAVLKALAMFVDEKWDDGYFHLISTESIADGGMELKDFIRQNNTTEVPYDSLVQAEKFATRFDKDWLVYVFYAKAGKRGRSEVLGLIAFSDWQ